jgi:hypothetical protein
VTGELVSLALTGLDISTSLPRGFEQNLKLLLILPARVHDMDGEVDQVVQAIAIASDPSQYSLHQQALEYLQTIQQNAAQTWRLALAIFVDANPDGVRKHHPQARFWALRVLEDFLEDRCAVIWVKIRVFC